MQLPISPVPAGRVNRARRSVSTPFLLAAIGAITIFWLFFVPVGYRYDFEEEYARFGSNVARSVVPKYGANSSTVQLDVKSVDGARPEKKPVRSARQTTIVSAFFDLAKLGQKTKHPPEFYLESGRDGVLSFDSPIIFFTDSPNEVAEARKQSAPRGAEEIQIVNVSLHEFDVVREHLSRVSELVPRDYEATSARYSGLLFIIYHAKPEMMRIAAEMNPFHTENFLWMDVGCVRNWAGISAKDYRKKKFPAPSTEHFLGREGRIMMGGVAGYDGPCKDHVRWVGTGEGREAKSPASHLSDPLLTRAEPYNWWIAGAIWGRPGSKMREYEKMYRSTLKRYLDKDLREYSLIDQYLMGAIACSSDLIEVVKPPLRCCVDRTNRKWFFLLMFFSGKPFPDRPYEPGEKRVASNVPCRYCDK